MRLLTQFLKRYFFLSVVILLLSIPLFYYVLRQIVIANVDARLIATKTQLIPQLQVLSETMIDEGPLLNNDITIERVNPGANPDSLFTSDLIDSISRRKMAYRLLTSHLVINQDTYRIQIKSSLSNHEVLISRIILVQIILLSCLFAGLIYINRSLSKQIWKPFYQTLQKLKSYSVDSKQPLRLEKSNIAEFKELNQAIEQLADRSQKSYINQKEFAENASHEMRTPLAVLQGKLELLMQTNPLTEEQARLMGELAEASQKMARLNTSLLLLTRIQNGQFPQTERLDLVQNVRYILQSFEEQVMQKQIQVVFDHLQATCLLEANPNLLEILLNNLISNAIRHNYPGGRIHIQIADQKLQLTNTGQPFSLNTNRLFQRFSKDSKDPESMGLGLEIVSKICELYGFKLQYQFENLEHIFTVDFLNNR
jgi:signal transduction histidine kinase